MTDEATRIGSRIAAVIGMGGAVALGASPSASSADGLPVFVLVGYALMLLVFAAEPRRRRDDLVLAALAIFGLLGLADQVIGRSQPLAVAAAECAGVLAAWVPGRIASFREEMRSTRRRTDRRIGDLVSIPSTQSARAQRSAKRVSAS